MYSGVYTTLQLVFEIADKFAVQPLCELLLSLRERVFDLLLELIPAYTHLQGSRGNIR